MACFRLSLTATSANCIQTPLRQAGAARHQPFYPAPTAAQTAACHALVAAMKVYQKAVISNDSICIFFISAPLIKLHPVPDPIYLTGLKPDGSLSRSEICLSKSGLFRARLFSVKPVPACQFPAGGFALSSCRILCRVSVQEASGTHLH